MDAQFWIYIAIGALYFLSRFFKKPEETGEKPERQPTETRRPIGADIPRPETRQLTFEELLREITEGKQAQQKPEPEPELELEPVPVYEKYEKELAEEARSLEEVNFNEAERVRWKAYEEIPPSTSERRSLEETLLLENTNVEFGKFAAFENRQRKKLVDDYLRIIRNPESLRQAVVMSEILKRKF